MNYETVYVGCLVINDDASNMSLKFNTLEYLNKKDILLFGEDPFKEFREMLSPEEFQASFGQYEGVKMSIKWIPDDWGYGNNSLGDSFVNKLSSILYHKRKSLQTDVDLFNFKNEIHRVIMSSFFLLKKYIKEAFGCDVFLFMSIVDSEKSKLIENESAKELNSEDNYNEFVNRTKLSKKN
jgi:hypothetical protein